MGLSLDPGSDNPRPQPERYRAGDDGQVLVLADLGMLSNNGGVPENLTFWRNLAEYARD